MKNGRFLAFVLIAAMLFSASACSKEPVEHEEQPIENTVIIKPAEEPESKTEIEHEETLPINYTGRTKLRRKP